MRSAACKGGNARGNARQHGVFPPLMRSSLCVRSAQPPRSGSTKCSPEPLEGLTDDRRRKSGGAP
jgi:hypothetical protein